jgi:hypothetical protein
MGNPISESTLTHAVAGFNSHKMTMNLGSWLKRAYLAPRDARYLAVPSPMPELAPVTRTTFPANSGILPNIYVQNQAIKNSFIVMNY